MNKSHAFKWILGTLAAGSFLYSTMLLLLLFMPRIGCCPITLTQ